MSPHFLASVPKIVQEKSDVLLKQQRQMPLLYCNSTVFLNHTLFFPLPGEALLSLVEVGIVFLGSPLQCLFVGYLQRPDEEHFVDPYGLIDRLLLDVGQFEIV